MILDERRLGAHGIVCPECQVPIDPRQGQWIPRNPQSTWGDFKFQICRMEKFAAQEDPTRILTEVARRWQRSTQTANRDFSHVSMIARSCSVAVVVSQQTTKSLPALDLAGATAHFLAGLKNPGVQSLMIAFRVVVFQKQGHRPAQGRLAEEDQPRKAFLFQVSMPVCQPTQTNVGPTSATSMLLDTSGSAEYFDHTATQPVRS